MADDLADIIEAATGARPRRMTALAGGCIAEVLRVDLDNGERVAVKRTPGAAGAGLALEAWMLRYLANHSDLPVPAVIHQSKDLLVMEFIESGGPLDARAQTHAAELLAELHTISAPVYGLERDTVIGALAQPNPQTADWAPFFRDQRLLHMARLAHGEGHLEAALFARIDALAGALDDLVPEPARPSLIHGDMWGGNVLCRGGRIAGFVDPAIYYADPEIELAFATLFGTFGDAFFARYGEIRPLEPEFFEFRRDLYNLYPLLVHVRLFGAGYLSQVDAALTRIGY